MGSEIAFAVQIVNEAHCICRTNCSIHVLLWILHPHACRYDNWCYVSTQCRLSLCLLWLSNKLFALKKFHFWGTQPSVDFGYKVWILHLVQALMWSIFKCSCSNVNTWHMVNTDTFIWNIYNYPFYCQEMYKKVWKKTERYYTLSLFWMKIRKWVNG